MPPTKQNDVRRNESEVLGDVLEGVREIQRALKMRLSEDSVERTNDDWQDYYIRGVNLANAKNRSAETNVAALRAYNEAIALAPRASDDNIVARLHGYRGAILKRLKRLDEAEVSKQTRPGGA